MRRLAAMLFLSGLGATAAQAMPAAVATAPAGVIQVSGGCGPDFHRGPYGRCVPNYYVRRACPPGYHLGWRGVCRPNY